LRDSARFVRSYRQLDALLVERGLPPTPEKWIEWLGELEHSGKRRAVVRKGRRVFASTCFAPRLAVCEMLFGEHFHVPGTPPLKYAFLSVKKDEAAERLVGVSEILRRLEVNHDPAGTTIRVPDFNAEFCVYVASLRTAVGGSVPWAWCDEVPRWRDDKAGANPAEQVIGAFIPATATHENAHIWLVGSPYSTNDYHAREFNRGSDEFQRVFFGESWVINTTLTEELTHQFERDFATWQREYAAIPSDAVEDNWFGGAIEVAARDWIEPELGRGVRPVVAIDPKFDAHTKDRFGWAIVASIDVAGERITSVLDSGAWVVQPTDKPSDMAKRVRELCQRWQPELDESGLAIVYSDQHEGHSFSELARQAGLNIQVVPWTGGMGDESKNAKFDSVKTAMLEGTFKMRPDEELMGEFRQFVRVYSKTGQWRIEAELSDDARGKYGHCDRATAVVLAAHVALSRKAGKVIHPAPRLDPGEATKLRYMRDAEQRRRSQWNTNPEQELRRRLGM
jgi:hypothetical protein